MRAVVLGVAALLALATASPEGARAQTYPSKPVKLIVPFTPGTGMDILARVLGQKIGDDWKASFVVDNRAGASGNIGTEAVAKAAPDGYTLLTTASTIVLNRSLFKTIPYDPIKDFAPIAPLAVGRLALVANPTVPAKNATRPTLSDIRWIKGSNIDCSRGDQSLLPFSTFTGSATNSQKIR